MEEDDLTAIRRELEAFDVLGGLGNLLAVCAVGIHRPELSSREEGYLALIPSGISLTLRACGQRRVACTIGINDGDLLLALVGLHTVVANLIDNLTAVGTGLGSTDTSHCPEGLGGHQFTCQLDVLLSDLHVVLSFCAAAETNHQRNSNH